MARRIAVVNQKGGVGKTTTVINLGAALALAGRQVLVVDMDPQGNATTGLGADRRSISTSIANVLLDGSPSDSAVRPTAQEGLALLPSTIDLAPAELQLVSAIGRERRLLKALQPLLPQYDYILLDAPPSLGILTVNCLVAADAVVVPVQCEYYALEGLSQLQQVMELVRSDANPGLQVQGVLLTMYDARVRLSAEVAEDVRRHFPGHVFRTVIPRNVRLSEAPSFGQSVFQYSPESKGAAAYRELAKEVMENEATGIGTQS